VARQVRAPARDAHAFAARRLHRLAHGIQLHIDAERPEPRTCERHRMPAAAHGDVERSRVSAALSRDPLQPFDDEGGR